MFRDHLRHLRFVMIAAIVLAFSSQVLLAQSHVLDKKMQTKQSDTLKTKTRPIKIRQVKTPSTKTPQPKAQPPKIKQIKKQPAKTQEGRVTKLKIGVTPTSFNGPCPKTFDFHCTITVNHSPVTVEYEWVRSDGVKGPKEQVEIRHGSVTVSDRWQLGEAKQHLREWEKVHIISPKDMNSPAAVVNVNCR
jgi:hypothetical protein